MKKKTSWNVQTVSAMSFEDFHEVYKDRLENTKAVYEKITGKKVRKKKEQKEGE